MKKFLALATVVMIATAGTAHANEFAGVRAELQTGLDVAGSKSTFEFTVEGEDRSYSERHNKTGLLYGLGIGYDAAISPVLTAGIEANLDFSNAKDEDFYFEYYDEEADVWTYGDELKAGRQIELAARIGYTVTPSTLLYVKGGYVNGRYTVRGEVEIDDGEGSFDYTPYN